MPLLTQDLTQARAFAERTLGGLVGEDETTRRLAETLRVVLEEHGSPRRASHRLGIHENTVYKRLRAIEARGVSAFDGGRRTSELLAALAIVGVTGDATA